MMKALWSCLLATCLVAAVLTPVEAQSVVSHNPHGLLPAGIDCVNCHLPDRWTPVKAALDFDHSRVANFALDGRHASTTCTSCHLDRRFDSPKIAASSCASCHVDVHQGKLSAVCLTCHNTVSFVDVRGLSIHAATRFPLDGAHMQVSCESCHGDDRGGAFAPLDAACASCHRDDYANAQLIDHTEAGFSLFCEQCHNTLAWGGGTTFDHLTASGGFPLVESHQLVRCQGCHTMPGAGLINTPADQNDCVACHRGDYENAHRGTAFPTECLVCHDQTDWSGGTFADHDARLFPIFTGKHSGKWNNDCATCHNVPGTFTAFTCLTCHEHEKTRMDDAHRERNGYIYESMACLQCHPMGRKE